jgi:predicted PurR-regulated permease PerM
MADLFMFVVGLAVMMLGVYYFLADHGKILGELERLSPLDPEDDRELCDSFVRVCRGVLLGNVLAAILQALLNGIGFTILRIETAWLLGFCTFFLSFVPFVGAGAVWSFVAIGLVLEQRYWSAGFLVAYGVLIVSSVDNLVRAFAIHGSAHIHPLVALVSILGAIQLLGLWGIVIGPVTAAFFYALLNILRKRLWPDNGLAPSALLASRQGIPGSHQGR